MGEKNDPSPLTMVLLMMVMMVIIMRSITFVLLEGLSPFKLSPALDGDRLHGCFDDIGGLPGILASAAHQSCSPNEDIAVGNAI